MLNKVFDNGDWAKVMVGGMASKVTVIESSFYMGEVTQYKVRHADGSEDWVPAKELEQWSS